jgi:GTP:adenosylcobinamide-phosphate guanylyltransferase
MRAVITAGGAIGGEYARLAGTNRKALALVRGRPMIEHAILALRACGISDVAVIGDDGVARACEPLRVAMVDDAGSGSANVLNALDAWPDDEPLLYLTSDMPFVGESALRWFLERVDPDTLAMPLTEHADYARRFPKAPPAGITLSGERVVNGGAIHIPAGARGRIRSFATALFEARKAPWRMATIAGPLTLLRFATGRASIASLEARAQALLGIPVRALRGAPPELAFDADTADEYRFALALD